MRFLLSLFLMSGCCMVSSATEKPILIVTPQGVWQINFVDGKPQSPIAADVTVIVQGFGNDPAPKPPEPPVTDQTVDRVASASVSPYLGSKAEAVACAALIDSLGQAGLSGEQLKAAMKVAVPIVDTHMGSGGRVVSWSGKVLEITTDPAKIKQGLTKAWSLSEAAYTAMDAAVSGRDMAAAESEAVAGIDIAKIMQLIMTIVTILQQLGLMK